ncbi:hypothetical protein [Desulfurobacterium sp. TC5-1]|uniref:hypothetical protein n=1 Tax=Desulfurobacterium sp. TC5-1 TaxID=1158318 RepID=UPI0003B2E48D|nr:hypothetical protein [Desulfurobacterium sp. TC5-1]
MKRESFDWIHQKLEEICDSISSTNFSEEEKADMIECMMEVITYFETISEEQNDKPDF